MKLHHIALAAAAFVSAGAQAASFELAGPDGTGFLSFSNVKAWETEAAAAAGSPPFPYFQRSSDNKWTSIVALPLSADSVYAEEASYEVLNKTVTQSDFSTVSAGSISYDESVLTGVGLETIAASALAVTVHGANFSPYGSPYNTGTGDGNFPWAYAISASNLSGGGLSFLNGVLVGVDLGADVSVSVHWYDNPAFTWLNPDTFAPATYDGKLSITGDHYAFSLDVTQAVDPLIGGVFQNTRMVLNREGTIAAVVPEPGTYGLMAGGLLAVGWVARRRRA